MTEIDPPKFGTDGLRGRAGEPPMDPETLRRVGAALGVLLQRHGDEQKRVLIGNDGRDSSIWILEALAQGLAAAEVSVSDVGLCTTPALAFLARTQNCDAAIMISASHNPADDNGIKIFTHDGTKLRDEDEAEIAELAIALRPAEVRTPRIRDRREWLQLYEEALAQSFPDLDLSGRRVCIDAANGGGAKLAPTILRAFGAEVIELACEPDGLNINEGVGALHPEHLVAHVREHGAHLGICLDGDGDRGIFVDELGNVRDGDDVLCLFGLAMHDSGELPHDTVVATVMSNLGLSRALQDRGVKLHTTPVGDRHVHAAMRELGAAIGGEQSGHILFADHHLVGDGLYTALRLLALDSAAEHGMAAAFAAFHRYPQRLINIPVTHKPDLLSIPTIAAKVAAVEARLGDQGRLLLRYSGTETKCRVMIESADAALTDSLCEELAAAIRLEIGA